MLRPTTLLLASVVVLGAPLAAGARRLQTNGLVTLSVPTPGGVASAHPFVNIKVHFGLTGNRLPADPQTFRAYLGRKDITSLFRDIVENGVPGKHAAVDAPALRVGRGVNRLRIMVRSMPFGRGKRRFRDVDRVRFRAVEGENHPPIAALGANADIILPGVPVQFDGAKSFDPDADLLTYHWDFGDGHSSPEARPAHPYADGTSDVTVRLTVGDGQAESSTTAAMYACVALDPGRTPGLHKLDAAAALELGAVAPGGSRTATFVVRNGETAPTSQLRARFGADIPDFQVSPSAVDLGPGEEVPVTVTFAPTAPGHQRANITSVACGANRPVVHLLAHGYGGDAPGSGPTLAADPVFGNIFNRGTFSIQPDGQRVAIDNSASVCRRPEGGGSGDLCVAPSDCVAAGEVCSAPTTLLEPNDLCSDGQGGLYLLSDEGTFTSPDGDTEKTVTVMRLQLGPDGSRTGADFLLRTNAETMDIACDRRPGDGRVYISKFEELPFTTTNSCDRDAREILTAIRRGAGTESQLLSPIDRALGQDDCNGDFDQVGDLEVTRDGSSAFVSFQLNGGIYRVVGPPPTPLEVIKDVDDTFQVHPDGAILYAQPDNRRGTTSFLSLYKVFPEQSVNGALPIEQHPPCATFSLPNNGGTMALGEISIAAGRLAGGGSSDAVVLVSFFVSEGASPLRGGPFVLGRNLRVQGTVAFGSPAGNQPCSVLGVVNVEQFDMLMF
jgi:PKD repeat protein